MIGMSIGNIFVTACTMPIVNILGNGNQQRGFLLTTILFAVIGFFSFMIITKNCKERYMEISNDSYGKTSIIETYKTAFKNGPWVVTILFALFSFIRLGAFIAITIYFCLQVLKNPAMISIILPLMYVAAFLASIFTPAFIRKFKYRNGNIIGLAVMSLSFVIMPFFVNNQTMFIVIYFIGQCFGGITSGTVFGMTADSVDYNEWKFGKRSEGTLYAGYSFATKVGMAIGGALVGYLLAFVGYDITNVTSESVNYINLFFYLIPAVSTVAQIIIVLLYKLDKLHPQIVEDLNKRRYSDI